MEKNLFTEDPKLNLRQLQDMWAKDKQAATLIYENHLQHFSEYLAELRQSFSNHDIYYFRQLLGKCIPAFNYLGMADVTAGLIKLERSCITAKDLILYEMDVQEAIKEIVLSEEHIHHVLNNLKACVASIKPGAQKLG